MSAEPTRPAAEQALPPTVVIQPSHGWAALQLRAIWEYREMLYHLPLAETGG